jgi:hypothetical protein
MQVHVSHTHVSVLFNTLIYHAYASFPLLLPSCCTQVDKLDLGPDPEPEPEPEPAPAPAGDAAAAAAAAAAPKQHKAAPEAKGLPKLERKPKDKAAAAAAPPPAAQ